MEKVKRGKNPGKDCHRTPIPTPAELRVGVPKKKQCHEMLGCSPVDPPLETNRLVTCGAEGENKKDFVSVCHTEYLLLQGNHRSLSRTPYNAIVLCVVLLPTEHYRGFTDSCSHEHFHFSTTGSQQSRKFYSDKIFGLAIGSRNGVSVLRLHAGETISTSHLQWLWRLGTCPEEGVSYEPTPPLSIIGIHESGL